MNYANYDIKCSMCGRRRGNHYSGPKGLIFCSHEDLQHYKETGDVKDSRFTPVNYELRPEIRENVKVVMSIPDSYAKKGQIGVVKVRNNTSARVLWNNGEMYSHNIVQVSLLTDSEDPNLLFMIKKRNA